MLELLKVLGNIARIISLLIAVYRLYKERIINKKDNRPTKG